jgi:hypothetical protein
MDDEGAAATLMGEIIKRFCRNKKDRIDRETIRRGSEAVLFIIF